MNASDEPREIPIESPADTDPEAVADAAEEGAPDPAAVATEEDELDPQRLQDRLLRLQAEFDNYRKREARDRAAAWGRAKADLVYRLLGALDDMARVVALDAGTSAQAVIDGVALVEKKMLETLEKEGLETIGAEGEPFDPALHEAISVAPAPTLKQDDTVAAVTLPGFRFGGRLLRPAQVVVFKHDGELEIIRTPDAGPDG